MPQAAAPRYALDHAPVLRASTLLQHVQYSYHKRSRTTSMTGTLNDRGLRTPQIPTPLIVRAQAHAPEGRRRRRHLEAVLPLAPPSLGLSRLASRRARHLFGGRNQKSWPPRRARHQFSFVRRQKSWPPGLAAGADSQHRSSVRGLPPTLWTLETKGALASLVRKRRQSTRGHVDARSHTSPNHA